jgi:hypothetical protein
MNKKISDIVDYEITRYINTVSKQFNISYNLLVEIWRQNIGDISDISERVEMTEHYIDLIEERVERTEKTLESLIKREDLYEDAEIISKKLEMIDAKADAMDERLDRRVMFCAYVYTRNPRSGEICNARTRSGNYCSKHRKNEIKLRLDPSILHLVHDETGFVFKSPREKIVIGKLKNGIIAPLDQTDLEICGKYGLQYNHA